MVRRFIRAPEVGDVRYDWYIFVVYILPGALSMIGSILVVLTYVLFKRLRKKRYVELMVYVSVSNFFFSLGGSLGPVPTYSLACWYQGIMTNVGYVNAALWITVINFHLWMTVRFTPPPRGMFWTHLFIWTVPLLFSLLPLSTNTYGNPGGDTDTSWCFVVTTTDDDPSEKNTHGEVTRSQLVSEVVWVWFSFYVWVIGAIILDCGLTISILWTLQTDSERTKAIRKQVYGLLLYPLVLAIASAPNAMVDTNTSIGSDDDEEQRTHGFDIKSAVSCMLMLLSGFMLSLVFFYVNVHAREQWWLLYERRVLGREAATTPIRKISGAGPAIKARSSIMMAAQKERDKGLGCRGEEGGDGGDGGDLVHEPGQCADGLHGDKREYASDHIPAPLPLPLPHTHDLDLESDPEHIDDPLDFLEGHLRRRQTSQYQAEMERNEAFHSDDRAATGTSTLAGQGRAKPKRATGAIELGDLYDRRSVISSSGATVDNPLSAAAAAAAPPLSL